jgi:hypothetical protein
LISAHSAKCGIIPIGGIIPMSKRHFTDEQKAEIIRRYQSGESLTQIGASFEAKYETIGKYLQEWGIEIQTPIKRKLTPAQESLICQRYVEGESAALLAKAFDVSAFTIVGMMRDHGIPVNPRGNRYRQFSADEIETMRQMTVQGHSQHAIAEVLEANQGIVSRVMRENRIQPIRVGILKREKHGSWKGGRHINAHGYYEVLLDPQDPMASMRNRTGYVLEHRLNLARELGRPLKSYESVHHINGDRTDNRLENLQLRIGKHGKGQVYCCADCGSRNIIQCEIDD